MPVGTIIARTSTSLGTMGYPTKSRRVLVCDKISSRGIQILSSSGLEVDYQPQISATDLRNKIGGYDALIVRGSTKVDRNLLDRATRLRVIGRVGVGLDNIDLDAASAKRITVLNTPTALTNAVAEHAIALMLTLAKKLCLADHLMKGGAWPKRKLIGIELRGKTLGLVGVGRIGQKLAKLARAFDMRILGYDIVAIDAKLLQELDITMLSLENLLQQSDFVSIHVPLTDGTRHLLDAKKLRMMKRTAFLVNTSRGAVIDEDSLYEALKNRVIAGAGLDVFEREPPKTIRLLSLSNVVCSPHIAGQTSEAQEDAAVEIAQLVARAFAE